MKKQKRSLAVLLALTLVLGLAAPCAAAEGEPETPAQGDPVSAVETTVTPTTPTTPADTPDTPAETPDTPADTPDTPADTPDTPADTPDTPADTPDTPADTPDTPADTPDTPADTPDTPADTPDTPADTPDTPADTPDTPPTTPTDPEVPTEPVDPTVPPAPTQEELDAAQKAQEEAAERKTLLSQLSVLLSPEEYQALIEQDPSLEELRAALSQAEAEKKAEEERLAAEAAERKTLLSQLSALLSPEEYQALMERAPSLEELRALKASLDEAREKEELIRQLRELLPEEEQAGLEAMSLEELRAALSQAKAEKKAEEERLAAEAAEREALLSQLSGLLSPEEYQALIERAPSLEELRALKASLDEAREKEELIQLLREILPEDKQVGLEAMSLEELQALMEQIMLEQQLFPMTLETAAEIRVTIEQPPAIQVNPYGLNIGGSTDSLISKPCLIISNTQAEITVTATATATATGGAQIVNQSTRSAYAMAAHQRDERNIFLFLTLKNLNVPDGTREAASQAASKTNWPKAPDDDSEVIPRSGEGTVELTMPAAGATPSYAAFKIGGDCSPASYLGEWKEGAWTTDENGDLHQGKDDGAEIKIVFTVTVQQIYNIKFVVEHAWYDLLGNENIKFVNPELIVITADGKKFPLTESGKTLVSEPVSVLAGQDLTFKVQSSTPPTEARSYYNSLEKITVDIAPAVEGYPKELFYVGDDGSKKSLEKEYTFPAGTIPVNATVTVTIEVYQAYYSGQ